MGARRALIPSPDQRTDFRSTRTRCQDGDKVECVTNLCEQRESVAAPAIVCEIALQFRDASPIAAEPRSQRRLA
ncbi:MAG: hypothetical protein BGO24_11630 [Sphingomonas sp. 67-36]|nr:MAG: hypothetical protein BGO24_11630 [Sphingomonas sp. 67-36]